LPGIASSLVHVIEHTKGRPVSAVYATLRSVPETIHHLGGGAVVLFTLWTVGELDSIKLKWRYPIDVMTYIACLLIWLELEGAPALQKYAQLPPATMSGAALLWSAIATGISAFNQELCFRGYLQPRLEQITNNPWIAWAFTSLVFGAWHLYQGWIGALGTLIYGAVLGLIYLYTRRLGVVTAVHFTTNLCLFALQNGFFSQR
jgi:membrane protease YdiL (CAAX protease family)